MNSKNVKLSELLSTNVLKKVTAKNNSSPDYYFLEDVMKEKAGELLEESIEAKRLPEFDIDELVKSLNYSLSCSQGDGVSFREGSTDYEEVKWDVEVQYYIAKNHYASHYSHNKTFEVEFDVSGESDDDSLEKSFIDNAAAYTEELRDICDKLEKFWYDCIEEEDKQFDHDTIFNKFLEDNNIEACDILYYSFGDKDEKNTVEIGEMESTNLSTYIEDFELVRHERKTLSDGEVVKVEYYYTPAK